MCELFLKHTLPGNQAYWVKERKAHIERKQIFLMWPRASFKKDVKKSSTEPNIQSLEKIYLLYLRLEIQSPWAGDTYFDMSLQK